MSDHFQRDPAHPQSNPWMRPMQPGQLTPNNQTRQPAVPVSPYTPNEPDQNEAIYAARAAQARRHLSQATMENPNSAVQQAMLQTARQAHANQSAGRPAPQQPFNPYAQQQGYPQQPAQQRYSQQPAQPYQRPVQQNYPQQPVQEYHRQSAPVQPQQRPMQQGYPQQPVQQRYPQQPAQPYQRPAQEFHRHSVPVQPQPVQPSVRTADHAILADPMLLEEVQQPATTRRRRSRMVMRQEQEAAVNQPAEPSVQQPEPAPLQEPATVAQAAQKAKEELRERLAQEAPKTQTGEWNLWNPVPEPVSGTIPVIEESSEESKEEEAVPEPAPQPEPEPILPESAPIADAMPELPQRPEMEEAGFVDPLAGLILPEEPPDEEDDAPAVDFVDTARMPIPQPVSTFDTPQTSQSKKKGYKLMTLLMVLMLLAAAAGFLWLSGLGEKLIGGASDLVQSISTPTVSTGAMTVSPEHAALPAKMTFRLQTDATITEMRLVTAAGDQLPAEASVTIAENGLDWELKCTLTEPYTGTVYAELLCADGQWRRASQSCYIEVN